MADDKKVVELSSLSRDEMKASVEMIKRTMDTWVEWGKQLARIRRAHYDAYIVEGFSPEQALILCQRMIM